MARMRRLLPFTCALVAASALAADPVYRCAIAGSVTFQQTPCASAVEERAFELPAFPPQNVRERDRLLAREAALDERLLRRAELESAERIAREARRAREAELQAERERAAETQTTYAVPLFFRPARAWRPRPPSPFRY
jgi:hypothetical protein